MRRRVAAAVLVAGVMAASTLAEAQTAAPPTITLDPTCADRSQRAWTIRVSGRIPAAGPNEPAQIVFNYGEAQHHHVQVGTSNGAYSATLSVPTSVYPGTAWKVAAYVNYYTPGSHEPARTKETFVEDTFRSPCPTTTTTTPTSTTTTPTTVPTTVPTTTPTTVPTSVVVPTLTVTPPLGPPGFVTRAHGTGFPPGPVALAWAPGIGVTSSTADAAGTFTVPILILRKDRLGPRTLTAVGGVSTASTTFLVVPAPAQPRRFVARR